MPLVLYNSLTRRKEVFVPLDDQNVRMYVCGPTVYDTAHIGNARAVVVFDLLYRVLRREYGAAHVKYVRNITDIDDRIIEAARANGEPIAALTERTTAQFHADMAALGTLPPDVEPRCTGHLPQMIAMIEKLIATGHAYAAQGHVLFRVASWPDYGKLSRRSRDELLAGARVEVAPYKEDPGDFVLWKPSAPEQPGWDSPWGRGRPGWHIECSAMSEAHLGESFDIHGGGLDLIFPHHENELAQSEAAHGGRPFVRFWVHNGFLSVDSTKMSKSLGNFVTVHELLEQGQGNIQWGEAIRFALLQTHYRDPLDWTEHKFDEARAILGRFYRALIPSHDIDSEHVNPIDSVRDALLDDLNTPLAISRLHEITHQIFSSDDDSERWKLRGALKASAEVMGLLQSRPEEWIKGGTLPTAGTAMPPETPIAPPRQRSAFPAAGLEARVREQIAVRAQARKERRFADADRIRAELAAEGIVLEDRPDGTTDWRRA
jgi:cysteinyl-tRNA synthetase